MTTAAIDLELKHLPVINLKFGNAANKASLRELIFNGWLFADSNPKEIGIFAYVVGNIKISRIYIPD